MASKGNPTASPARLAKASAPRQVAAPAESPAQEYDPQGAVMDRGFIILKNLGFAFAVLILWAAARFLFIRLQGPLDVHTDFVRSQSGFMKYDILFILLPAIAAFFLNWYWLRDQRTDVMTRWAMIWGAIDLVTFALLIFFFGAQLHLLLMQL